MSQSKPSSHLRAAALATVISLALIHPAMAAGPLTPPGAPAPTGKSLQEISDQVEDVGADVAEMKSCLSDTGLCDGGTFLVIDATRTLSAWKPETGNWSSTQASTEIVSTTSSEGNYLVIDKSRNAYAWSRETGTWQFIALDGILSQIHKSEGNFAIRTTTNRVYTWAFRTGTWNEFHVEPGIVSILASP